VSIRTAGPYLTVLNDPASMSIEYLLTLLTVLPEETIIGKSALGSAMRGALTLLVPRIFIYHVAR
jgi:small ligand-binding sensory domain FIST